MPQHWSKGMTKEKLKALKEFKKKASKNRWSQSVADSFYFGMTFMLVVFSVFVGQALALDSQLPALRLEEVSTVNALSSEFERITNITGDMHKDFDSLETYQFNCKKFDEEEVYGIMPNMAYFCAITSYGDDVNGIGQNFKKSLSGIIYYYALLHGKAIPQFGEEEWRAKMRSDSHPEDDKLFNEWQALLDEHNEKTNKIENLIDVYAMTLRKRIDNFRTVETYHRLVTIFLIIAGLLGICWSIAKNWL